MADVEPEQVCWLWQDRIPFRKISIIDGDPGLGKSILTLALAAIVSRGGTLPDGGAVAQGTVVLLNVEDGLADTIRPRLEAAGADLTRVIALTGIPSGDGERLVCLPHDIEAIEQAVRDSHASLVIIDPLMAFLASDISSKADQDVRRALAPLATMAERTGAAVVLVRHLNKAAGASPLYRGGGSIGIIGAARSGLLVASDPDNPQRRVLASVKSNLGPPPPAIAYEVQTAANGAALLLWCGTTEHTARQLLTTVDEDERSELTSAADVLRDLLRDGPMPVDTIKQDLARAGVSWRTAERAKAQLRIVSRKEGFGKDGKWIWSLPAAVSQPAPTAQADSAILHNGGVSGLSNNNTPFTASQSIRIEYRQGGEQRTPTERDTAVFDKTAFQSEKLTPGDAKTVNTANASGTGDTRIAPADVPPDPSSHARPLDDGIQRNTREEKPMTPPFHAALALIRSRIEVGDLDGAQAVIVDHPTWFEEEATEIQRLRAGGTP